MNAILEEIKEIPQRANEFLASNEYSLPLQVPYLGMGSSYFAPLSFKHMGIDIQPELASEYYSYLSKKAISTLGVILSQSGKSTEALWCAGLFEKFIAVTNNQASVLCKAPNLASVIPLLAREEKFSSSKTYINTLLALYKGFGEDIKPMVQLLEKKFAVYEEQGRLLAEAVFALLSEKKIHGIYITGSGPNIGTALEAALILSESTKLSFLGLPLAQYDHGPKETAANSIVICIIAEGESYARTQSLIQKIKKAGASVLIVEEPAAIENHSILYNIVPFNFMAFYLAQKLNVKDTFLVGGKVTVVE